MTAGLGLRPCLAFALAAALMAACVPALGDEDAAVEAGRQALSSRRNYPWYDRQKDATRPLRLGKQVAPRAPRTTPRTGNTSAPAGLFGGILQVIGLLLLTALLAAVAALVAWAFLRNEQSETHGARVVETSRDVDRVEDLPFQVKRPSGDFLAEARRLYEAGCYSEAVLYLYSHMLVQLDRHHIIRLAKGKTNRQYLRETRLRPILAGILETTMVAFEDVFFGHHTLDKQRCDECFQQVDRFHADLVELEKAAA